VRVVPLDIVSVDIPLAAIICILYQYLAVNTRMSMDNDCDTCVKLREQGIR
jgi:hypothetical protein